MQEPETEREKGARQDKNKSPSDMEESKHQLQCEQRRESQR